MDGLNIGAVSQQSGMQPSAIRYYESVGLLPKPRRVGGWRHYEPGVLHRLRVIRVARELGFAIDEIRILLEGFPEETPPPERWRELAARKLPEIEGIIARATAMRQLLEAGLRCECMQIDLCFDDDGQMCSSTTTSCDPIGASSESSSPNESALCGD